MSAQPTIPAKIHSKQLADFLGVTHRRIHQLADEGVIPKGEAAMYPFAESIRGLLAKQKEKAAPARERLDAARARREERKDRQEAGDDIPAPVVTRAWEGLVVMFKQRSLRVGNNVQSKIGLTEPQRAAIDEEIRNALSELDKKITYAAVAAETDGDEKGLEALK